ncbi:hypothetical protein QNM99_06455 [Pseudomonas sp. PCH446]
MRKDGVVVFPGATASAWTSGGEAGSIVWTLEVGRRRGRRWRFGEDPGHLDFPIAVGLGAELSHQVRNIIVVI